MRITQPVNLSTDLVLGSVVGWLAFLLIRAAAPTSNTSVRLWGAGFAGTALAAFSGGLYHGLLESPSTPPALVLWKITMLAVGLAGNLFFCGGVFASTRSARLWLLAGAGVKLAAYVTWITWRNDFGFVVANYAIDLLGVLVLQAYAWWTWHAASAVWVAAGFALAFAAAAVQRTKLAVNSQFDHNDLYHLIQVAAMWLLYRGGLLLRDPPLVSFPGPIADRSTEPVENLHGSHESTPGQSSL